ncbi:MAG: hypothetical protein QM731_20705 [Chitinophagaceae bacterium]
MEQIIKTPQQVAERLQYWFLRYYKIDAAELNGTEVFTFFHLLPQHTSTWVLTALQLQEYEIPVLALRCNNEEYIINTTERFARVTAEGCKSISYKDFDGHKGYKSLQAFPLSEPKITAAHIKSNGSFATFLIRTKDGSITEWTIPTGEAGFAFWSVTQRCEVMRRRYLIVKQ